MLLRQEPAAPDLRSRADGAGRRDDRLGQHGADPADLFPRPARPGPRLQHRDRSERRHRRSGARRPAAGPGELALAVRRAAADRTGIAACGLCFAARSGNPQRAIRPQGGGPVRRDVRSVRGGYPDRRARRIVGAGRCDRGAGPAGGLRLRPARAGSGQSGAADRSAARQAGRPAACGRVITHLSTTALLLTMPFRLQHAYGYSPVEEASR